MERRFRPRTTRSIPIGLSTEGQSHGVFRTRDLGVDGLFLETGTLGLQHRSAVLLHVETSLAGIAMQGEVVRTEPDGVAIRFDRRYPHYAHDVMVALMHDGRLMQRDHRGSIAARDRAQEQSRVRGLKIA